jgi:hypothetical protein
MIYTIGDTESYKSGIATLGDKFQKLGSCNLDSGEAYQGGSVWQSLEGVNAYLRRGGDKLSRYSAYGVKASWRDDTMQISGEPYRRLLNTSQIVGL